MSRDEAVKRLAVRVAEDIEERYGRPPNFIELQSLIRRFVKNNPDADPEDIDWVSVWDPKLEYSEILKVFQRRYPMYKWDGGEEYDEQRYFRELYDYLLVQARDLPEELRNQLVKELALEIGIQPSTIQSQTQTQPVAEARQSAVVQAVEKKPTITITLSLLSKYPILPEMSKFLSGIQPTQMPKDVFKRVYEKIADTLEHGEVKRQGHNHYFEVLSYPAAVMVLTAVGNDWLKRRWALAEGIAIEKRLDVEDDDVFDFIVSRLGFEKVEEDSVEDPLLKSYSYRVPVTRYLKIIGDLLRDIRWKLVNQMVHRGYVYVRSRAEVSRIVREIMKNLILYKFTRVNPKDIPREMPAYFWEAVEEVRKILVEKAPKQEHIVIPVKGEVPPCMMQTLSKISFGEDVSHIENFAVAAYMTNVGYSIDEILEVFKNRSDFNERIARYQVEHIAGLKGSRIKYKPPSCSKMKSYGLCIDNGAKCPRNIKNPLFYVKRLQEPKNREVAENESK